MNFFVAVTTVLLLQMPAITHAGTLTNGEWTPSSACGEKPVPPSVVDHDADAYNRSVGAINQWQQQANTYFECLINEANKDNKSIADKANHEQTEYKQTFESISAALDAAKKKLEQR